MKLLRIVSVITSFIAVLCAVACCYFGIKVNPFILLIYALIVFIDDLIELKDKKEK